jgi:hypothetical protein
MEIGFSSEQIFDIGLNLAGYLTAGMIFLLLRSLFPANIIRPQPVISVGKHNPATDSQAVASTGQATRKINSNFEYIDLKGVSWRPATGTKRTGRTPVSRPAGIAPKSRFAMSEQTPAINDQFKHTAGWRN